MRRMPVSKSVIQKKAEEVEKMAWTQWEKVAEFNFTDIIHENKRLEAGGGVARVTINRPDKLNAFTSHTVTEIATALDDASHEVATGVVILTGTGERAFCAGGDVEWEAGGG